LTKQAKSAQFFFGISLMGRDGIRDIIDHPNRKRILITNYINLSPSFHLLNYIVAVVENLGLDRFM
jgi:hypothetical protein